MKPHRRPTLELSRRRKMSIYAVCAATWLSGAAWLLLHYFARRHGDFGDEPNPFEFWTLASHGAFAFAMLWTLGWLWPTHVLPWWRSVSRRRRSGIVLLVLAAVLIASGYLLYYASGDAWRDAISLVHWLVGLAAIVPLLVHVARSGRYRRERH